jgi:hypothetical protein
MAPTTLFFQLTSNSKAVMSGVAAVSKIFMTFGSYTGVYNMNPFLKILYDPHRTRPILTGMKKNEGEEHKGCGLYDEQGQWD